MGHKLPLHPDFLRGPKVRVLLTKAFLQTACDTWIADACQNRSREMIINMSNQAVTWALRQTNLSTGEKLVLLHLADCHSPVSGCFLNLERLAQHCGMSSSTTRRHLNSLEKKDIIHRERRLNSTSPILYVLHFTGHDGGEQ